MSLAKGSSLGSYQILSLLGAGGMGEVYRAKISALGAKVAIKDPRKPLLPLRKKKDPGWLHLL